MGAMQMTAKQRYALIAMTVFLLLGFFLAVMQASIPAGILMGLGVLWSIIGFGPPDAKRN